MHFFIVKKQRSLFSTLFGAKKKLFWVVWYPENDFLGVRWIWFLCFFVFLYFLMSQKWQVLDFSLFGSSQSTQKRVFQVSAITKKITFSLLILFWTSWKVHFSSIFQKTSPQAENAQSKPCLTKSRFERSGLCQESWAPNAHRAYTTPFFTCQRAYIPTAPPRLFSRRFLQAASKRSQCLCRPREFDSDTKKEPGRARARVPSSGHPGDQEERPPRVGVGG